MVLKFQKYQTMDTMAQCASNKPPTSCLRPQTDVYPTAGRNQTLEGFTHLIKKKAIDKNGKHVS
jgi:hypothetical protein